MAEQWYFAENGQQQGPVNSAQLAQLAASGRVQPNSLVWREGLPQWIPASSLKGLFPAQRTVPPSLPPIPFQQPGYSQPQQQWPSGTQYPQAAYQTQVGTSWANPATPDAMVTPSFGRRFLSNFLDSLVLLVPNLVIGVVVAVLFFVANPNLLRHPQEEVLMLGTIMLSMGSAWVAYFWLFHYLTGKTPGKMMGGLLVVKLDGSNVSSTAAFFRAILLAGNIFLLAFSLLITGSEQSTLYLAASVVGGLWVVANCFAIFFPDSAPMQRALHDRICGTRVVRDPRAT